MKRKPNRGQGGTLPGSGQLRCHCGRPAVLHSAEGVCKSCRPGAMVYVCADYPTCDSFVMAHPGTLAPMGSLAGPELRRLRYDAHKQFDRLHQSGLMTRKEAYRWLSYIVQAPMEHAHIGHLGEYYCQVVIEESRKLLARKPRRGLSPQKTVGGECYVAAHG